MPGAPPLAPMSQVDRVPRRQFRVRGRAGQERAARRVVHASPPARPSPSWAAAARARRAWSTCCRGSTTSPAGTILIDGIDITRVGLASLRDQIGMVTQETVLFDDTIASNIAYGRPGAPVEAIEAAARAARAHEFILGLPEAVRDGDRRAGAAAVRRPAPAPGHRPRPAQGLADPDSRRGDLGARFRVGSAGAGRAGEPDARPHVVRHRPPALDDPAGRCHHRAGARARRRGRPARRPDGQAGRRLRGAARHAVRRAPPRRPRPPERRAHDQEHDGLLVGVAGRRSAPPSA